jgi:Arm DNA-binding domain
MATVKFTDNYLKSLKPKEYLYQKRDSVIDGLCIAVKPSSAKTFTFQYSSPDPEQKGKRPYAPIGPYLSASQRSEAKPLTSIAEARDKARQYQEQVIKGFDPLLEKDREKATQAAIESGSFGSLLELYISFLKAEKGFQQAMSKNCSIQSVNN